MSIMSVKQVDKQLGVAENITHDFRVKSQSQVRGPSPRVYNIRVKSQSLVTGAPRAFSTYNYSNVQAIVMRSQRNIRQLILKINARISPKDSNELTNAELSRLVRLGKLLLQQLRRLFASGSRFVDFKPMKPLQEAIAYELAKKLGCQTRFYNGCNDSCYLVAYSPGVEPSYVDVRACQMCRKDVPEIASVKKEGEVRMEPMSFPDGKLHWHQPMEFGDRKKAANPPLDIVSLGAIKAQKYNVDIIEID